MGMGERFSWVTRVKASYNVVRDDLAFVRGNLLFYFGEEMAKRVRLGKKRK